MGREILVSFVETSNSLLRIRAPSYDRCTWFNLAFYSQIHYIASQYNKDSIIVSWQLIHMIVDQNNPNWWILDRILPNFGY